MPSKPSWHTGDFPLNRRLVHLVLSLLTDDAVVSTELLVEVMLTMAKRLPPSQRAPVASRLIATAAELDARLH
jgi:hypothetical protein